MDDWKLPNTPKKHVGLILVRDLYRLHGLPGAMFFTAYYSTGIPNIEDYAALLKAARQLIAARDYLRPLLKPKEFAKVLVAPLGA